jgi:hypothetical protein
MFSFFNKPLQVVDFPRKAYAAYWEIHPFETLDGFVREVRILGYDGSQKDIQVFTAGTEKAVDKKVQEFLSVTMQKHKRV